MAFVNEWISQEDIEKYGLIELCDSYRGDEYKYIGVKEPRRKVDWTIDREREIWMIEMASVTNPDFHLPSPSQETIFILHYQGKNVEVRLWEDLVSKATDTTPLTISWKFLAMAPNSINGVDEAALKTIVCEALQTYKRLGINSKKRACKTNCVNHL
jgi:hypothetical protein